MKLFAGHREYKDAEAYLLALTKRMRWGFRKVQIEPFHWAADRQDDINGTAVEFPFINNGIANVNPAVIYWGNLTVSSFVSVYAAGEIWRSINLIMLEPDTTAIASTRHPLTLCSAAGIVAVESGTLSDDYPGFAHLDDVMFNDVTVNISSITDPGAADATVRSRMLFHGIKAMFS